MAKWRLQLAGLDGSPRGEIYDPGERTAEFNLYRPDTLSFTVAHNNPVALDLVNTPEGIVRLYRDDDLVMTTNIVSVQVVRGVENRLAVTCQEAMWFNLSRRLAYKTEEGKVYDPGVDKGLIVMDALDEINTEHYTGVTEGNVIATTTASNADNPWQFKVVTELMLELSQTINGFEWCVEPRNTTISGVHTTSELHIGPFIEGWEPREALDDCIQTTAVFEYGPDTRASINSYELQFSNEGVLTRGWSFNGEWDSLAMWPPTSGGGTPESDARGIITERGLFEAPMVDSDLEDQNLREELIKEHVQIRNSPRQILKLGLLPSSTGRTPEFFGDFFVGSVVNVRIKDPSLLKLNALVRVYGVRVSVTDTGLEQLELTLVNEAP